MGEGCGWRSKEADRELDVGDVGGDVFHSPPSGDPVRPEASSPIGPVSGAHSATSQSDISHLNTLGPSARGDES